MHIDLNKQRLLTSRQKNERFTRCERLIQKKKPRASSLFFSYGHGWGCGQIVFAEWRFFHLTQLFNTTFDHNVRSVLSLLLIYGHSIVVSIVARFLIDIVQNRQSRHLAVANARHLYATNQYATTPEPHTNRCLATYLAPVNLYTAKAPRVEDEFWWEPGEETNEQDEVTLCGVRPLATLMTSWTICTDAMKQALADVWFA